jgi:hypothetical protein
MSLRVRMSRSISRRLLGAERMLCSEIVLRGHWSERYIDALFLALRGERWHCLDCAVWEANREPGAVDELRRSGLL